MTRRHLARRGAAFVALAFAALAVFSAAAFAAVRTGTDGPDTLLGTDRADRIAGLGGDDTTVGKGGNDSYSYADGWGKDLLKDSGGKDTLNFSDASADVWAILCPERPTFNGVKAGGQAYEWGANAPTNRVDFASRIENARMGSGNDSVYGCSGTNGISGGPGNDMLADLGGFVVPGQPIVPKSDDRYSGFGPGSGTDTISDAGGAADVLDLRPLRSADIGLYRIDFAAGSTSPDSPVPSGGDGEADSLLVRTGEQSWVKVVNYFAPDDYDAHFDGRVEKIVLGDKTISPDNAPPLLGSTAGTTSAASAGLPLTPSE